MVEQLLAPLFQANVDEGILREMAEADYGWEAENSFEFLREVSAVD